MSAPTSWPESTTSTPNAGYESGAVKPPRVIRQPYMSLTPGQVAFGLLAWLLLLGLAYLAWVGWHLLGWMIWRAPV